MLKISEDYKPHLDKVMVSTHSTYNREFIVWAKNFNLITSYCTRFFTFNYKFRLESPADTSIFLLKNLILKKEVGDEFNSPSMFTTFEGSREIHFYLSKDPTLNDDGTIVEDYNNKLTWQFDDEYLFKIGNLRWEY
jgi:hypothetical protein